MIFFPLRGTKPRKKMSPQVNRDESNKQLAFRRDVNDVFVYGQCYTPDAIDSVLRVVVCGPSYPSPLLFVHTSMCH